MSSIWSQSFFYKSAAAELCEKVSKYKDLPAYYKGGVTYLFLQLKVMFFMSHDTINALKKYLNLFEDKGLCRIHGENVTVAEKEKVAVCLGLNEMGALTYEMLIAVLAGLTN